MDVVTLLAEARAAGLTICVDGDRLLVTGPKSAEPIVKRLAEHKPAVMVALRTGTTRVSPAPIVARPRLPTSTAETVAVVCQRCGSTQYVDVPIHRGQSTRRDCQTCGRFIAFPRWYGVLQPSEN